MKLGRILLFSSISLFLTSCSTLSPINTEPSTLQSIVSESNDQQQLNDNFNTATDNKAVSWRSDGTQYTLTTNNTHVNDRGQPCRSYNLLIQPRISRGHVTTGVVCRDDKGQWQVSA